MSPTIDYNLIAEAIRFYEKRGYKYIEAPWLVSKASIDATIPPGAGYFETPFGHLVGSGEQSFLEIKKDLCPGRKYLCATPCFRDEKYDEYHFAYFFKVELILPIWKDDDPQLAVDVVFEDALKFFQCFGGYGPVCKAKTDIGVDLQIEGIEVGSYGWREHDDFRWAYGTGCAEPRLSQVKVVREKRSAQELQELLDDYDGVSRRPNQQTDNLISNS